MEDISVKFRCIKLLVMCISFYLQTSILGDERMNNKHLRHKRFVENIHDIRGPYCFTRADEQCCPGRDDQCTVPFLDTVCFCDVYCNETASDCCPDYWYVCHGIGPPPLTNCNPGPTDVIFLLDTSESETTYFNVSLQYMKHFTEQVPVSHHDFLFSVITYSTDARVEFSFGEHVEKSDLLSAMSNITHSSGATYTAKALEKAFQVLSKPSYGVRATGSPKYVIVLTDGLSTDRMDIETVSMRLSAFNTRIMAVGIGSQVDHKELLQIATSPAFVFSPESNDVLQRVLIESVGKHCDVCWETSLTDIFILFDTSSDHQSKEQFSNALDILETLIKTIDLENTKVNICIATFDEVINSVFCLGENETSSNIMSKIQHIHSYNRRSDVISGIEFVRQSSFVQDSGERPSARKILIISSPGHWDYKEEMRKQILLCQKANITVILVGAGHGADLKTMYDVADTAHNVIYLENAKDTDALKSITSDTVYVQCKNDVLSNNHTYETN